METFGRISDSRGKILQAVRELGFDICPFVFMGKNAALAEIEAEVDTEQPSISTVSNNATGAISPDLPVSHSIERNTVS